MNSGGLHPPRRPACRGVSPDSTQLPLRALRATALRFAPGDASGTSGNCERYPALRRCAEMPSAPGTATPSAPVHLVVGFAQLPDGVTKPGRLQGSVQPHVERGGWRCRKLLRRKPQARLRFPVLSSEHLRSGS